MKLSSSDGQRCLSLLDKLDAFSVKTLNVFKKGETVVGTIDTARRMTRIAWQANSPFIEKFILANKDLCEEDTTVLRGWKDKKRSQFLLMKYYPEYALFFSIEDKKYYGVLALVDSFKTVLPHKPPILVETSLLPYNEHIVWDGLAATYGVMFDKSLTSSFGQECDEVKNAGMVITSICKPTRANQQ